jgi:hypothetical protein
VATIAILWFAGASAMAGLLNIVPRYLPRYGMAPAWARAIRPLVIVFTLIAILVTIVFKASVDGQNGAYATGVLALISSAAVAVTLSARRKRQWKRAAFFAVVALILVYTLVVNVVERPDGIRIALLFVLGILIVSFASRLRRSFEIRATSVTFDDEALEFLREAEDFGEIHLVANEPGADHLPRGGEDRLLRLRGGPGRARHRPARVPGARGGVGQRAEHDRDRAAADPQPHGRRAARLLRVDGGEPGVEHGPVPGLG